MSVWYRESGVENLSLVSRAILMLLINVIEYSRDWVQTGSPPWILDRHLTYLLSQLMTYLRTCKSVFRQDGRVGVPNVQRSRGVPCGSRRVRTGRVDHRQKGESGVWVGKRGSCPPTSDIREWSLDRVLWTLVPGFVVIGNKLELAECPQGNLEVPDPSTKVPVHNKSRVTYDDWAVSTLGVRRLCGTGRVFFLNRTINLATKIICITK